MIELIKIDVFDGWLRGLRDTPARARITARIRRLSLGNPGEGNPAFSTISKVANALGLRLSVEPLSQSDHQARS